LMVARSPALSLSIDDVVARTGWLAPEVSGVVGTLRAAGTLAIVSPPGSAPAMRFADAKHLSALSQSVLELLSKFHQANPLLPGMSLEAVRTKVLGRCDSQITEAVLRGLVESNQLMIAGETVRLASHRIVLKDDEEKAKRQISKAFENADLAVPSIREVLERLPIERKRADKIFQLLIQEGTLVRISEDLVYHAEALKKLRQRLTQHKTKSPRISVSTFKDLAGVSRKYAIPLLEYLDRERVTRRDGDERVIL